MEQLLVLAFQLATLAGIGFGSQGALDVAGSDPEPTFPPLSGRGAGGDGAFELVSGAVALGDLVDHRTAAGAGLTPDGGLEFSERSEDDFAVVHFVCACDRAPTIAVSFDLEATTPDNGRNSLYLALGTDANHRTMIGFPLNSAPTWRPARDDEQFAATPGVVHSLAIHSREPIVLTRMRFASGGCRCRFVISPDWPVVVLSAAQPAPVAPAASVGWCAAAPTARQRSVCTVHRVATIAGLVAAVENASPWDEVVLAAGDYTLDTVLTLAIAANDATVRSDRTGAGTARLLGGTSLTLTGDRVRLEGFTFTGDRTRQAVHVIGHNVTISDCSFIDYRPDSWIVRIDALARFATVERCHFEMVLVNTAVGASALVQISVSPDYPGYHVVRWCSFLNCLGPGGDFGQEPIRIGTSATPFVARALVEHCYFENVGGADSETISVKSSENVIRFNTFTESPRGMLVFRQMNRNVAFGNFFFNNGGVRVKNATDILIASNYFSADTARINGTLITHPIQLDYVDGCTRDVTIAHNLFFGTPDIDLGGVGPMAVAFINNIHHAGWSGPDSDLFTADNAQTTFTGNIYFNGTLGGLQASTGLRETDAQLEMDPLLGFFRPGVGSPAIDGAVGSPIGWPLDSELRALAGWVDIGLAEDISGQTRPVGAAADIGCQEHRAHGAVRNTPLTLADVGPLRMRPTATPSASAPVTTAPTAAVPPPPSASPPVTTAPTAAVPSPPASMDGSSDVADGGSRSSAVGMIVGVVVAVLVVVGAVAIGVRRSRSRSRPETAAKGPPTASYYGM